MLGARALGMVIVANLLHLFQILDRAMFADAAFLWNEPWPTLQDLHDMDWTLRLNVLSFQTFSHPQDNFLSDFCMWFNVAESGSRMDRWRSGAVGFATTGRTVRVSGFLLPRSICRFWQCGQSYLQVSAILSKLSRKNSLKENASKLSFMKSAFEPGTFRSTSAAFSQFFPSIWVKYLYQIWFTCYKSIKLSN